MTEIRFNKRHARISAAWVAKMAMLTAIAFLLYYLGRFIKLPMIFPSFLDIQISELPALLAGFSMGPVSGCLVIIFKCLLKFPLSSTSYVGELTDILLGISFVLPASIIYRVMKTKRSALWGMLISTVFATLVAILINRFISIPFYLKLYFGNDMNGIIGMLSSLYPGINIDNFWAWYLGVGILPFNILRYIIVSLITFVFYKHISKILHWDGTSLRKSKETYNSSSQDSLDSILDEDKSFYSKSVEDTYILASAFAKTLKKGDKVILEGELGAGKTTFTKGIAQALGIQEEVTSPTFTIMNSYDAQICPLYHLDMYRIDDEDEIYELGIEDNIDDGITIIEWNKLKILTGKIFVVRIESLDETHRKFTIEEQSN